ncbi:hypothetical protein L1049_020841 [Liquidambar formosana]|uniref:Fe2OG dioxygenase domain-containing protein n=1 Tax=Liquidambar formosana TaxID=63359 RepID=A0AAP0S8L6_LIQFO
MRLSTSFDVNKEKVHNWRDYLRLHCYPLGQYVPEWPSNPPSFKDIVSNYCTEVRQLGHRLQEFISESLGLPGQTYGLPGHTDPNAPTILLQDLQAAGLQVLKDRNWLSVNPYPDAFVIKVGDQLQTFTCRGYVWHRTIPNTDEARLSVSYFLCQCDDAAIISPAEALTDDGSVTIYKSSTRGGIPADHGDILAANSCNPGAQAAEAQAGGSSTREPSRISSLFRSLPTVFKDQLKEVVQSCIVDLDLKELSQKVVKGTSSRERVQSGMIIMVIMALRKYL